MMIHPLLFVKVNLDGEVTYIQAHEYGIIYEPQFGQVANGVYWFTLTQVVEKTIVDVLSITVQPRYGLPKVRMYRGAEEYQPVSESAINDMYRFTFWLSDWSQEEWYALTDSLGDEYPLLDPDDYSEGVDSVE